MDKVGRIKKPRSDGEATCRSTSCSIIVLLWTGNVDGLGRSNAGIVVFEKLEVAASQLTKLVSEPGAYDWQTTGLRLHFTLSSVLHSVR